MKPLRNLLVLSLGVMALMVSASMAQSPQDGTWKKETVFERRTKDTAESLQKDINDGNRPGMRKASLAPVPDTEYFDVVAEVYYPAERPAGKAQTITGNLTAPKADARGVVRHTVTLTPGARYTIELQSGTGATRDGKALPGFFDPVLLVEDDQGRQLGFNDDIDWPRNCNSRVTITAPTSGTVRLVVSSYRTGESGPYTILVQPE
jgi:hypothetical protein